MDELLKESDKYSIDEIRGFLDHIIMKWEAYKLTPAAMNALLKFVYLFIDQPDIQIRFKNQTPFPICYFSSFLLPSASFLYSYLKTLSFAVRLFSLDKTERHLKESIEQQNPPAVLLTISQFLHVDAMAQLVPYLHTRNLTIIIGGIPFVYDQSLKRAFSDCLFPQDVTELVPLLENSMRGDQR